MKNEDNAKTMVRTRRMPFRPAPNSDPDQSVNVLPVGTHLGEFEILDLIGEGGFGIVYLAYDHSLERHVALKEYMPSGLATRTTSMAVTVRSQHNAATFTAGLKSFINEARMLAQFDSPSLVKVHRFWEGNGTAYMVMPFYEGITLKQALKERRITPSESWIRLLLADLFDALETIHHAHCLHRDIAPDNILLLKDGRPLLLDFGAARRVIGDLTQCLTVILKPGFAPIEQYADIAGLRQGEWTDIYALAAVVYYLITGKAPPPAVARMVHDELVPARKAGKGRYSDAFLAVLDKALSVKPEQRYRSVDELRRALDIMETVPRTLPRDNAHWATTAVRTTVIADPKPVAREEPKPKPHPATKPQPGAKPQAKTEPKASVRPKAQVEEKQDEEPEITQYFPFPSSAERNINQSSPMKSRIEEAPKRDKTEWLVLGLLLSAGIASGIYLGTNRSWNNTSPQSPATTSGSSAVAKSSGASGAPQQVAEDNNAAAATPPSTPAREEKAALPSSPVASAAPQTSDDAASQKQERHSGAPLTSAQLSEIEIWRSASASDKVSAYESYLREYPKGRYAALAKLRLERKQTKVAMTAPPAVTPPPTAKESASPPKQREIKPQEARSKAAPAVEPTPVQPKATETTAPPAPSEGSAEEDLWATVTSINDGPAYEAYLYRFPKGRYAAIAKDKLASYKPPVPPASATPQAPDAAPAEHPFSESTDKPPAVQPAEPSATPARNASVESAPPSVPEPPVATGKKTLKVANQTMTGDFTVDPKTGVVSGTGKIVWSNGDQFEGTLVNGKKEGKGKFSWANGQRYNGDWARDVPNGKGTIVFTDGSRYEGEVKDGVPHGEGVTRFKGGDVYRGSWVRGKSHGPGRYTWANGSYWEGEFKNDKRTENGKMVFAENTMGGTGGAGPAMSSGSSTAAGKD